jgi:hypothetical protein
MDFYLPLLTSATLPLSPDGNELYYTISTPQSTFQTIVSSKKDKNGSWSKPEVVSFGGLFSDLEPALSADGNKLYFASNRPLQGSEPKDFDIWIVERKGAGWSDAKNLGSVVNTSSDEFYPSIAKVVIYILQPLTKEALGGKIFLWRPGVKIISKNRLLWILPSTRKDMSSMPLLILMNSLYSLPAMAGRTIRAAVIYI